MSSLYMRHGIQETFNRSLHFFTHKNVKTLKFLLDAYKAVCVRLMSSLYIRRAYKEKHVILLYILNTGSEKKKKKKKKKIKEEPESD